MVLLMIVREQQTIANIKNRPDKFAALVLMNPTKENVENSRKNKTRKEEKTSPVERYLKFVFPYKCN